MSRPPRCIDCRDEGVTTKRDAPHPGPRCTTHHRRVVAARKQRAHALHVERTYGITAGEYQTLLDHQGGRCAICERATGKTRRLAVDHDHETGLVRGLLCKPCNRMLGHGRDEAAFFRRAYDYLLVSPAKAAGIVRKVPL